MSHHFDTDQAKADPRLNICDLYVFKGGGERTVLAMTCCADAGISSPDLFHPEGTYAFRIDLDGDNKEELAFKFRFGEPQHVPGVMSIATNNHLLFGELPAMKYPGPAEHSSLTDSLGTWSRWQRSRHSPAWLQNYGQLMRSHSSLCSRISSMRIVSIRASSTIKRISFAAVMSWQLCWKSRTV